MPGVLLGISTEIGERQHNDRKAGCWRRCRCGHFTTHRRTVLLDRADLSFFLHGANETEAFARQRLYQKLLLAGVADSVPGGIKPGRQRRLRDDAAIPDGAEDIVLRNDALSVADQIVEQIETLRRERDYLAASTQFATTQVKLTVCEEVAHSFSLPVAVYPLRWAAAVK